MYYCWSYISFTISHDSSDGQAVSLNLKWTTKFAPATVSNNYRLFFQGATDDECYGKRAWIGTPKVQSVYEGMRETGKVHVIPYPTAPARCRGNVTAIETYLLEDISMMELEVWENPGGIHTDQTEFMQVPWANTYACMMDAQHFC